MALRGGFLHRKELEEQFYLDKMSDILATLKGQNASKGPARLMDHLYLGNRFNAEDLSLLKRLGITHVLNCAGEKDYSKELVDNPYPESSGVTGYLEFEALDNEYYPMMQHYRQARRFINKARTTGGRVLAHCEMGVNRSATLCVAYMMELNNSALLSVVRRVKLERPVVLLNEGFRRQLVQFAWDNDLLHSKE